MKFMIVIACLLAAAYANEDPIVLRYEAEVNPEDFKYGYEFDNSIKSDQSGSFNKDEAWEVKGQYSYTSPEGENVAITYTADQNGYRVDAASPLLPTPPPIPEAIQRSLEYLAKYAAKE